MADAMALALAVIEQQRLVDPAKRSRYVSTRFCREKVEVIASLRDETDTLLLLPLVEYP